MKKKHELTTSVSLPLAATIVWRSHRKEIMRFAERYLRIKMRKPVRREVTRSYNRLDCEFIIVTTRFAPAEYDTLHFVAASLRLSVSSLIYGIIQLWKKPTRRTIERFFETNCSYFVSKWDPEAGFLEEFLTFYRAGTYPPQLTS
ncbi:MAG: hypothetical protein JSR44_00065 [Spirochaetes bacterium]|nr:hypothetical protein [Spirochaetota bacterium]